MINQFGLRAQYVAWFQTSAAK